MGRPTQRAETGLVSNWVYDTAIHGVGALAVGCTSSSSNPTCSSPVSARTLTYDAIGRATTAALTINGVVYTYATSYNATNGQIDTVSYPSGLAAKYAYATNGSLSQITNNTRAAVIYTVNSRDAEMHLTQGTFGNGVATTNTCDPNTGLMTNVRSGPSNAVASFDYSWDTIGNLTYRADNIQGVFERYCYDSLNRLNTSALGLGSDPGVACTGGTVKSIAYDAVGNITSKTGVGTYSYPAGGSPRPHAISSITGTVNGVTNPTYTYDANGNMLTGAGRTVTPTAFNMTASIVQGSTTVALTYGDTHKRIRQTIGGNAYTYLNDPISGAMSERYSSVAVPGVAMPMSPLTSWYDYIQVDGHIIAQRLCRGTTPCSGASEVWDYFTLDHLGSIAAVTDGTAAVAERDAYDPWGKRRNLNGTDDSTCSLLSLSYRGFAGEEHVPPVCQINLNARIYDPTIGRFMSADSIVPDARNIQAFNRYSYVYNGPLNATDASGNDPGGCEAMNGTAPVGESGLCSMSIPTFHVAIYTSGSVLGAGDSTDEPDYNCTGSCGLGYWGGVPDAIAVVTTLPGGAIVTANNGVRTTFTCPTNDCAAAAAQLPDVRLVGSASDLAAYSQFLTEAGVDNGSVQLINAALAANNASHNLGRLFGADYKIPESQWMRSYWEIM